MMKLRFFQNSLGAVLLCFAAHAPSIAAAEPASDLFGSLKLVYEDDFTGGSIPGEFWEVRQNTTWKVVEGVLTGAPSSKEFQEKKVASGDPSHAGFKPVIWLRQVPENLLVELRMRFDAEDYHPRFPLLDIGHHIHSLTFGKDETKLTLTKNVEVLATMQPLLKLNHWHDVVVELKKGVLVLAIDGVKHRFESGHIDMAGHAQIDFKGVDFGGIQIDRIRLWEGLGAK
jgi:hypothetical protein